MAKLIKISCPGYQFDDNLDLAKVSKCIDDALLSNFKGKNAVIRGIQSGKHNLPKEKLVKEILRVGSDRFDSDSPNEVKVYDRPIDLFGYVRAINKPPIVLPTLEGFHKYKPKCLEKPQLQIDIWMIYDADKLENVEYNHGYYAVKANDGYVFKDKDNKTDALVGVLVITE